MRDYLSGAATPPADALVTLLGVLGADAADELLAMVGLGGCRRLDADAASAQATITGLAGAAAELSRALEDGRVDHRERALLRVRFERLIGQLHGFSTSGG